MVVLKHKLTQRIPATTLVETSVALMIVLSAFGTGMAIYFNLISNQQGSKEIRAEQLIHKTLEEYQQSEEVENNWNDTTLSIITDVEPYTRSDELRKIHLTVFDRSGRLVAERYALQINKPYEED